MNQELLLKALYPHTQNSAIARLFGVEVFTIENKAFKRGLKKSAQFRKDTTAINWFEGKHENSKKCHFKPGQIPLNKGKKQTEFMSLEAIEKTKNTRFKSGQLPHNHYEQESGVINVRTDNSGRQYKWIKVAHGKWEMLHRHVWEQANGKVEKGYIIIFKDGNSLNCDLQNLECITLAENMQRNTINNFPEELKTNIILNRTLNRKIKKLINNNQ
jgi:hypothetical protein